MAKNVIFEDGDKIAVVCTDPASPVSGDPVLVGQLAGLAETSMDAATGLTTVRFKGVATLSVKGVDGGGNSAVAVGDILYDVTGDTPKISKKASGIRYGYALGTVTSGSTATIRVKIGF